jgi:hypothetical protein
LLRHLCFSSSFLRLFNPGGSGHVKGARAHRAQRGLPLTWPRQDYIALFEEEEKRRSNRQPRAAARGRPPPWSLLPWLAVRGRSTRPPPVPGSTQPGSQRPFDLQRSAATGEGCGGTLPPRCTPAHAHAASASTEAPEHALLPSLAPRLRWPSCSCIVRPGLDAGALGHDIAKPCKEGEKPVERQTPSALPSGAGRSGTAADLQERSDWRSPLTRGTGGDRESWHGQSAAAPVLPAVPLGGR